MGTDPPGARSARSIDTPHLSRGWLVAIACAYLYVFPYFPAIRSANELPRVYLVKAIVDHHTFAIDDGVARWGATADVSPSGGHSYSNKAPGSSLLAVPAYAVASLISSGEPGLAFTTWLCRVVTGVIPTLIFLWFAARWLARYAPDPAVRHLVIVAYALGSMAMTYSILFISHQLAAICIASAWMLAVDVVDGQRRARVMLAVGLLAGAAPLVDYQAAFAGVPVLVYLIARMVGARWDGRRIATALAIAAAGAAVPIAVLLAYHAACFGSPLRTGYDASETFAHFHQVGFLGMHTLSWTAFVGSTIAPDNGLVTLAPWLLLALPGVVVLARRGDRASAALVIAVAVVYLLFISSINFWRGGWGVGPRYITALLPFLLPAVAAALTALHAHPRWLGAAAGLVVVGVVIYAGSAATFPHFPERFPDPLYEVVLRLIRDGAVAPNLGTACGLPAVWSLVPYVALVAGIVGCAIRRAAGWSGLAIALAVGVAIVVAYSAFPRGTPADDAAYERWVRGAIHS